MPRSITYFLALTLCFSLAACGLRGPLYLPKEDATSAEQKTQTPKEKEGDTGEDRKKDQHSP